MSYITCANGHRYNPALTSECPECAMMRNHTVALDVRPENFVTRDLDEPHPSIALTADNRDYSYPTSRVEPIRPASESEELLFAHNAFGGGNQGSFGETMFVVTDNKDNTPAQYVSRSELPITGWLVCIDGPEKGKDYRLHSENNYIGRGARMDVCIVGDNTVSYERHARLTYDPEEMKFFFTLVDGKGIVRKNGTRVDGTVEVQHGDRLKIGQGTFLFVPLCGENFSW